MFILSLTVEILSIWQVISIDLLLTNLEKCFCQPAQTIAWQGFQPLTYVDVKEFTWCVKWWKNAEPIYIYADNTMNSIRKVTAGVYANHSYALG